MADLDAALVQQIFNIPQRERKSHIHHLTMPTDLLAAGEELRSNVVWAGRASLRALADKRISSAAHKPKDSGVSQVTRLGSSEQPNGEQDL